MAQFEIRDAKGQIVGSVDCDMKQYESKPVDGKPNSGGKRFVRLNVSFAGFGGTQAFYKTNAATTSASAPVADLKL